MAEVLIDTSDLSVLSKTLAEAGGKAPLAVMRATNWTGDKARTQTLRVLAKQTGAQYGAVKAAVATKPASTADESYELIAKGKPLSLSAFGARQTAAGVSAAPWGKRKLFPHAFLLSSLGGRVFVRTGAKRLPIRELWGPSIAAEMVRDEVPKAFSATVTEQFADRLAHELARIFPAK